MFIYSMNDKNTFTEWGERCVEKEKLAKKGKKAETMEGKKKTKKGLMNE